MLWPDGPLGSFADLLVNKLAYPVVALSDHCCTLSNVVVHLGQLHALKKLQFPIHFINGVDNVNWPQLRDLPWCDVYLRVIILWCPPWTLKNVPLCRGIFNSVSRGLSWKGLPLRESSTKGKCTLRQRCIHLIHLILDSLFLLGGMSDLSWWHLHSHTP